MLEGVYMSDEKIQSTKEDLYDLLKILRLSSNYSSIESVTLNNGCRAINQLQQENQQLKEKLEQKNKVIKEAIFKTKCVKEHNFDRIGRYEILDILNKGVDE